MTASRRKFDWIPDQMLVVALILALLFWLLDAVLSVRAGKVFTVPQFILGFDPVDVWRRIIVACLFLIFGSHAQYAVNKRKEAENALRKSEKRHRMLFETMAQGVIYQDRDLNITAVNPSAERILGYAIEELRQQADLPWQSASREDGSPVGASPAARIASRESAATNEFIRVFNPRRNAWRYISVNAAPLNPSDKDVADELFITFDDITQLKTAEEKLLRQNAYMTALHDTALGLLHRLDVNDLLQAIVDRAARLVGTSTGFLYLYDAERKHLELKVGIGPFKEQIGLILKPDEGLSGQVLTRGLPIFLDDYQQWEHRSPNPFFSEVRSVAALPLKSERSVEGVLGIAHLSPDEKIDVEAVDILEQFSKLASLALDNARLVTRIQHELAERRRAEQESREMESQLRRAQKLEAMGTLAGGIAHDFNNILGAIIGYTEMGLYTAEPDTKVHHCLNQVLKAGYRAKDLASQILSISRERQETMAPIQVAPIAKEALKLLRASLPTTIDIRQRIDPEPVFIHGISSEIHQVIMNLCTNAAHAMEAEGGVLTVDLTRRAIKGGTVPGLAQGDYLALAVSDTGHGMSPEVMERIFDPYFTTKKPGKGTGLGLATTHRIVRNHKGAITVDSAPGNGAVFTVLLPSARPGAVPKAVEAKVIPGGGERILLVDDEPALIELGRDILERLAYQVDTCLDPLKAIEKFAAAPNRYDLVITDMTMPHVTGDLLARRLMEIREDIPIILCTGFSELMNADKARKIGVREFILKPLSVVDLSRAIRNVLNGEHP